MSFLGLDERTKNKLINIFQEYEEYGDQYVNEGYLKEYDAICLLFNEAAYQTKDFIFSLHESMNKEGFYLIDDILYHIDDTYENSERLKETFECFYKGEDMHDASKKLFVENVKEGMYDQFYDDAENV